VSTQLWLLAGAAAYLAVLILVLALLKAAKSADEAEERAAVRELPLWATQPVPPERRRAVIEASGEWLARRMADAHAALNVERIAVVLRDPADRRTWVVEACVGVRGLCGTAMTGRTPGAVGLLVGRESGPGRPWSVASAPIAVDGDVVGEVAVATRRAWGLRGHDDELLERLAALLARHARDGELDAATRRGAA
jgi:hypothetical protein